MHANYDFFPNSVFHKLKVRRTVLYSQPDSCSVKMKYTDTLYSTGTLICTYFQSMALHTPLFKNRSVLNFGDRHRRALTSFSIVKFTFCCNRISINLIMIKIDLLTLYTFQQALISRGVWLIEFF